MAMKKESRIKRVLLDAYMDGACGSWTNEGWQKERMPKLVRMIMGDLR